MGGVQLEQLNQSSFEQYGPWHFRDSRFHQDQRVDLGAALLRAAALPVINDRLTEFSSKPTGWGDDRTQLQQQQQQKQQQQQHSEDKATELKLTKPPSSSLSSSSFDRNISLLQPSPTETPTTHIPLTVGKIDDDPAISPVFKPAQTITKFGFLAKEVVFSFPPREIHVPSPPRPNLKRRRPDTDVDGVNTASLSCKKRRLLRNLVTSRLSTPFSFPATHIINREGVASGDKRFLKLAAIMSARRLQFQASQLPYQNPSSMLRRHALHNSHRMRMSAEGITVGMVAGSRPPSALQQPQPTTLGVPAPMAGVGIGARFPAPSGSTVGSSALAVPRPGHLGGPALIQMPSTGASRMPSMAGLQTPLPPVVPPSTLMPPPPGSAQPRLRIPSPRLRPVRSPELRVTRPALLLDDLDDLDDDGVAFPTSELESRYEDDAEDAYSEFGLVFGVAENDGLSDDEGENFEDYMDDVDGIPWNARC